MSCTATTPPPTPVSVDMSKPADSMPAGPDLQVVCTKSCYGVCVDTRYDPSNCGDCGKTCGPVAKGVPGCLMGVCGLGACAAGYRDCNGKLADGCEVHSDQDVNNCGGCNNVCSLKNATAGCQAGACTVASCVAGLDDCNKTAADGCEASLMADTANCGACGMGCNVAAGEMCTLGKCVSLSFNVLKKKDITYSGINYVLLKVSLSSPTAVNDTWCVEYEKLCQGYGASPTGCGDTYTSMVNGYSFGFHYCDNTTCQKQMCTGNNCNTALSYIDLGQDHGYTLCKK